MPALWVDPFSGFAGDVWIGGFAALGVPEAELRRVLRLLPFPDLDLKVESVMRCGIQATRVHVLIAGRTDEGLDPHLHLPAGPHRGPRFGLRRRTGRALRHVHGLGWKEIDGILASTLPVRIADPARAAFQALGRAEARVHGIELDRVHFHEVGTQDSIADVVLACAGWTLLGEPEIHMGPIAVGRGRARMAHGHYPIPGPAALLLLEGFEIVPGVAPLDRELCTPTGAALAATLTNRRGTPGRFIPRSSGFSAGGYDFPDTPAVCRWVLGDIPEGPSGPPPRT